MDIKKSKVVCIGLTKMKQLNIKKSTYKPKSRRSLFNARI